MAHSALLLRRRMWYILGMGWIRLLQTVDWSKPRPTTILALLCFISRAPFWFAGVGFDNDVWLILNTAAKWLATGEYATSRGPGYFLTEAITTILLPFGLPLISILNSAMFAVSVLIMARIMNLLNLPYRGALLWFYCFAPISWIVSSEAVLEYSFWIVFALGSVYYGLKGNLVWSGIFYGLTIATRPSHGIPILLAYAVLWYLQFRIRSIWAILLAITVGIGLWVVPVVVLMGDAKVLFWHLPNPLLQSPSWETLLSYIRLVYLRFVPFFGILGTLALVLISVYMPFLILRNSTNKKYSFFFLIVYAISLILFIYGPYKYNYLVLFLPFFILSVGLSSIGKRAINTVLLVSILQNFISCPTRVFYEQVGQFQTLYFPFPGTFVANYISNTEFTRHIKKLIELAPDRAIVVVSLRESAPISFYLNKRERYKDYRDHLGFLPPPGSGVAYDSQRDTWFVAAQALEPSKVESLFESGYKVYYTVGGRAEAQNRLNIDVTLFPALPYPQDSAK